MDLTIAVNDGSRDASPEILARWSQGHPRSYVIDNPVNKGKASALKDGLALVALLLEDGELRPDDLLYTFDADGQHTVDSIDSLAETTVSKDLDMLLTRRDFSHYPRFKKIGNWGLSLFASLLSGYRYADVECGLRVIRVGKVPELLSYYNGYKYSCEQELGIIAGSLGYRIENSWTVEVPYYRAGTKVPDGIINVSLGTLAWLRVRLGLRTRHETLVHRLGRRKLMAGPGASLPRVLDTARAGAAVSAKRPAARPVGLDR